MDRKLSIRFYKDREVRAVWDGKHNKWWFSVLDIIGVLNEQDDYSKNRNYWKYLKTKLKKENNELVSATNQLKLQAPDGKLRLTDVLDNEGIMLLARNFPNNKAADFLDWFTYSDNTIDGQSRKKAYTLLERIDQFHYRRLCQRFAADSCFPLWWFIRFCRTDPNCEYCKGRFPVCYGAISPTNTCRNRTDAGKYAG